MAKKNLHLSKLCLKNNTQFSALAYLEKVVIAVESCTLFCKSRAATVQAASIGKSAPVEILVDGSVTALNSVGYASKTPMCGSFLSQSRRCLRAI